MKQPRLLIEAAIPAGNFIVWVPTVPGNSLVRNYDIGCTGDMEAVCAYIKDNIGLRDEPTAEPL